MDWRISGRNQALLFDFIFDGQFVIPDSFSTYMTVRGNDGTVLAGYDNVQQFAGVSGTQFRVTIPAIDNTIDPASSFENRFVRVDYTYGGVPLSLDFAYRLYDFIPHTVNCDQVRSLIGAAYEELPDRDIDILSAYFSLLSSYGTGLRTAIESPTVMAIAANKAIGLKTAIDLCQSFPSRILKDEKSDNAGYTRNDIDFQKLEADLRNMLQKNLDAVSEALGSTITATESHTLFLLSTQTDRITNQDS